MSGKKVMKLASRGKRFGAGVIDAIVPFIAYIVMVSIFAANGMRYSPYNGYGFGYGYGYGFGYGYDYGRRLSGSAAAAVGFICILLIAYIVAEFIFFAKGKSIGKAILGLQVVSSVDGRPFRFWKMAFREVIVKSASGVFLLGYIWILIDEKNRAWHDKILDSYVVDLKESERMKLKRQLERAEETAYKAERAAVPHPADPEKKPAPAPKAEEIKAAAAETVIEAVTDSNEPVIEIETVNLSEAAAAVEDIAAAVIGSAPEGQDGAEGPEAPQSVKPQAPAVSMSMKKEELLEAARKAGVKVSSKATKAEILEAIEKASEKE